MERKQVKAFLDKYKRPLSCARFILIYLLFLNIAKYTSLFDKGLVPGDFFGIMIIGFIVVYHFFSIALIPALIFLWIIELIASHNKS